MQLGQIERSMPVAALRRTNVRYLIIAVIFLVTTLNNADRATLSIVGTAVQKDLGISSITMGYPGATHEIS